MDSAPEASTSRSTMITPIPATTAPKQQQEVQQSQQQVRKGTRQESFESRGKKSTIGSQALTNALIYNIPLPLYLDSSSNSLPIQLIHSLTWTLSLSYQILSSQFKNKQSSRNRIGKEAYLEEKIVGYWDERTKSVWVLPTRPAQKTRRKKKKNTRHALAVAASEPDNGDSQSTTSSSPEEGTNAQGEQESTLETPWMDLLWKRGFFGKGSLSRSEPTWWQREKNRVTGEHVPTAEDITSARRADRVIVKKQKAQERADEKEKQAIALAEQRKPKGGEQETGTSTHQAGVSSSTSISSEAASTVAITAATEQALQEVSEPTVDAVIVKAEEILHADSTSTTTETPNEATNSKEPESEAQSINKATRGMPAKTRLPNVSQATLKQEAKIKEMSIQIPNLEYTQLQREEAFFIALCTGSIDIYERVPPPSASLLSSSRGINGDETTEESKPMKLNELWKLFTRASIDLSRITTELELQSALTNTRPDNPFIISYVVYHHYRSLGWVVRNGVKFCVDWVLYKGADGVENPRGGAGPVGGHAEFAVAIIPTYQDPSDAPSSADLKYRRDWRWLNTVNRVCSGVKKTVILTYVTIPRMRDLKSDNDGNFLEWRNPGCLKYYNVKEVSLKRFIPTRMRD